MSTRAPPSARAQLESAGLRAKKSWGQNFLIDDDVLHDIGEATGAGPTRPVLELGAGLGALTRELLRREARVLAVERDREIVPVLRRTLGDEPSLEIREANAAELDYAALAQELGGPLTVAGNLPYQLSSRILVELANAHPHVGRAVLLLQREVAERLCAPPGDRTYGLLSVLVQRSFQAYVRRGVPPEAFYPPPKVHSAVAVLVAHPEPLAGALDRELVATSRAAFSARRKTLRNALAGALRVEPAVIGEAVLRAGVEPGCRAETLGIPDLLRVASALKAAGLLQAGELR